MSAGLGPLGREYLLAAGGTGYFRLDVVRSHLESGHLRRVPGHAGISLPGLCGRTAVGADPAIHPRSGALAGLREAAGTAARKT